MGIKLSLCIQVSLWMGLLSAVVQAVPVPDDTLGGERSQVRQEIIRGVNSDRIEGGARRGNNLFHSFRQLDVEAGRGAYFSHPVGVENIFGRVTGNLPSNIQGTLGVVQDGSTTALGTANLFLMNPNGIVFGQGARLDVGGSFVGTTADAIGFGDQGRFSAIVPEVPSQLLIVNPSAFLFSSLQNQAIILQGEPVGDRYPQLQVPNGQSLVLLGGEIQLDDYLLFARGGRTELGSVAAPGIVNLEGKSSSLELDFPASVARSDISLDESGLYVFADNGGEIFINARNINLLNDSELRAGIATRSGFNAAQAGNIEINATGTITISGSGIANLVGSAATGNSGAINIITGSLLMTDGTQLSTSTRGKGNAGDLTIQAWLTDKTTRSHSSRHFQLLRMT